MAWLLFAVCAACTVLGIVFALLSWQMYMRRLRKGHVPQSGLEVRGTGNGSTVDIVDQDRARGISNQALETETNELQ